MNKKTLFKTLIGGPTTVLLPAASLFCLSSCQKHNDVSTDPILDIPECTTTHQIAIPTSFPAQPTSDLEAELIGEHIPEELEMASSTFPIVDKKTTILINIDESLRVTKNFNYSISISYTDNQGQTQRYEFNNCASTFVYSDPEKEEDELLPSSVVVQRKNNHDFDFKIRYNPKKTGFTPTAGQPFQLTMEGCGDELSFLGSSDPHSITCPLSIDRYTNIYYVNFIVHLNMSISSTDNYSFNLKLNFTNSFEKQQDVTINNLIVSFICERNKIVPDEYFTFKADPTDETCGILTGLSDEAPASEHGEYNILQIPEKASIPDGQGGVKTVTVTSIDENAFNKEVEIEGEYYQWFSNISKVIFNSKIEKVAEDAFDGCTNLYYIDISAYKPGQSLENPLPKWIPEGEQTIAPFSKTIYKSGYFIVHQFGNKSKDKQYKSLVADRLVNISLNTETNKTLYLVCDQSQISNESFFELDDTGTRILGIRDNVERSDLEACKIIQIPEYITSLGDFALTPFGKVPYKNYDDEYETRRIIFSPYITEIGVHHNVGLGGPIILNMPELTEIPNNAFQDVNSYAWSVTDPVQSEKPYILFINSDSLHTINNGAFIDVPFDLQNYASQDIIFPTSLTYFGAYAFRGNKFSSITFPAYDQEDPLFIGTKAFAQADAEKGNGKLKEIHFEALKNDEILTVIEENANIFDYSLAETGDIYFGANTKQYESQIVERMKQNGFQYVTISNWTFHYQS